MFISQSENSTALALIQGSKQQCTNCGIKARAEAEGVEPSSPGRGMVDYKSTGLANAQRFRSVIYISHYHVVIPKSKNLLYLRLTCHGRVAIPFRFEAVHPSLVGVLRLSACFGDRAPQARERPSVQRTPISDLR